MASAQDLAAFILNRHGPTSAMKLQKLCYYAQAWSIAWNRGPIFEETIEAWVNGPVVASLWEEHKGQREVAHIVGDPSRLSAEQALTVESVLEFYGHRSAEWLSELTHREAPWLEARQDLDPKARGTHAVSSSSLAKYYGAIASEVGVGVLNEAYGRSCDVLLSLPPHEVSSLGDELVASQEEVENWLLNGGMAPWETSGMEKVSG